MMMRFCESYCWLQKFYSLAYRLLVVYTWLLVSFVLISLGNFSSRWWKNACDTCLELVNTRERKEGRKEEKMRGNFQGRWRKWDVILKWILVDLTLICFRLDYIYRIINIFSFRLWLISFNISRIKYYQLTPMNVSIVILFLKKKNIHLN